MTPRPPVVVELDWQGELRFETRTGEQVSAVDGDGRAALYEGLALVSLYVVLATLVWFE